jgi:hypothetical protein
MPSALPSNDSEFDPLKRAPASGFRGSGPGVTIGSPIRSLRPVQRTGFGRNPAGHRPHAGQTGQVQRVASPHKSGNALRGELLGPPNQPGPDLSPSTTRQSMRRSSRPARPIAVAAELACMCGPNVRRRAARERPDRHAIAAGIDGTMTSAARVNFADGCKNDGKRESAKAPASPRRFRRRGTRRYKLNPRPNRLQPTPQRLNPRPQAPSPQRARQRLRNRRRRCF